VVPALGQPPVDLLGELGAIMRRSSTGNASTSVNTRSAAADIPDGFGFAAFTRGLAGLP
jgi:hypothetical protein